MKNTRGVQLTPTKYADKIPLGHTCLHCGRGVDEVNFTVQVYNGKYAPSSYCNFHLTPLSRGFIKKSREEIRQWFRDYFEA